MAQGGGGGAHGGGPGGGRRPPSRAIYGALRVGPAGLGAERVRAARQAHAEFKFLFVYLHAHSHQVPAMHVVSARCVSAERRVRIASLSL